MEKANWTPQRLNRTRTEGLADSLPIVSAHQLSTVDSVDRVRRYSYRQFTYCIWLTSAHAPLCYSTQWKYIKETVIIKCCTTHS